MTIQDMNNIQEKVKKENMTKEQIQKTIQEKIKTRKEFAKSTAETINEKYGKDAGYWKAHDSCPKEGENINDTSCETVEDCEGLYHIATPGEWACVENKCVWKTKTPGKGNETGNEKNDPGNSGGDDFQMSAPFVANAMSINSTHVQVEVRNGGSERVEVQEINLDSGGCSGISAMQNIAAGELQDFSIECTDLTSGDKFDADFALRYKTPGSSIVQKATGSIRGVVPSTKKEHLCAREGEKFSEVYDQYPEDCCNGLTKWDSGMDTRISIGTKCYKTNALSGSPVGTCIKKGDGFCSDIEDVCNSPEDCKKVNINSDYTSKEEFCGKGYEYFCEDTPETENLEICELC